MKLTEHDLTLIQNHGTLIHCPMDHILQDPSLNAGYLYFVRSGRLRVYLSNANGKELTLDIIHKGDFFGDNSFLQNGHHRVTIQTVTETDLIVCETQDILRLSKEYPDLSNRFLQYFITENNHLTHLLETITLYSASARVMDFLLTATEHGKRQIPYTHEDVALCLSLNRVTVSRILKQLCDLKLVESSYGIITVLKPEDLQKRLDHERQ
ncbi:MAG: Crp/Fnr family transcriptional regulator [Bulleidia sp.]